MIAPILYCEKSFLLVTFLLIIFTTCASDKIALEERDGFIEYVLDIQKQVSEEPDIKVLFSKDCLEEINKLPFGDIGCPY
ncbi:MAG: hypothetical protein OXC61_11280 [Flavobacteriaceae bacterium]|nr:hypothetical protein [Flavobacteriaceae bacterium]